MRRSGVVLAVLTDDANYDRAVQLLEHYGAENLDAREAEWRSANCTGYTAADSAAQGMDTIASTSGTARVSQGMAQGDKEVIPVIEEQPRVGKREVDKGRR